MGVYAIRNRGTSRIYVGCSMYIEQRWEHHRKGLTRGWKSSNPQLLEDWQRLGEDAFEFVVLEVVHDRGRLNTSEVRWIDRFGESQVYNMQPFTGRNLYKRKLAAALDVEPEELIANQSDA